MGAQRANGNRFNNSNGSSRNGFLGSSYLAQDICFIPDKFDLVMNKRHGGQTCAALPFTKNSGTTK